MKNRKQMASYRLASPATGVLLFGAAAILCEVLALAYIWFFTEGEDAFWLSIHARTAAEYLLSAFLLTVAGALATDCAVRKQKP